MTAWDKFRVQLLANGRSSHTINQYQRHIGLISYWADTVGASSNIDSWSQHTVAQFLASSTATIRRDGKQKKVSSMNCLRDSVRAFFAYLHAAGLLSTNPARLVRRALSDATPPLRRLTPDEAMRLLSVLRKAKGVASERDHRMFYFMLTTGVRVGSAVRLRIDNVDLERLEARIPTGKNNQSHRIVLGPGVAGELAMYLGRRRSGPLFPARHGGELSTRHVGRRLAYWAEKAEIARPITPHNLRHTFATELYRRTGDVLLVKEALNHRSISSTLVYTQPSDGLLRRSVAALECHLDSSE